MAGGKPRHHGVLRDLVGDRYLDDFQAVKGSARCRSTVDEGEYKPSADQRTNGFHVGTAPPHIKFEPGTLDHGRESFGSGRHITHDGRLPHDLRQSDRVTVGQAVSGGQHHLQMHVRDMLLAQIRVRLPGVNQLHVEQPMTDIVLDLLRGRLGEP